MELADFFIGKPGPGSISEAALKQLPITVRCDRSTLAHERYNCDWIVEQGIGVVIRRQEELRGAVDEILRPERLKLLRERLSRMSNRAVFEIPSMLEEILASAPAQASSRPASARPTARPMSSLMLSFGACTKSCGPEPRTGYFPLTGFTRRSLDSVIKQ